MNVSRTRNDDDELPIVHLAAHIAVSLLSWTLAALIALTIYRIGQLV